MVRQRFLRDTKDPAIRTLRKSLPKWRGDDVVLKGGMWSSTKTAMRIGTRAPSSSILTTSTVGFRLAKDPRPGFDAIAHALRAQIGDSPWASSRAPQLEHQAGIERWDVDENGRITGYHTVSFVPVESRQNAPSRYVPIAFLHLTDALAEPALDAGNYELVWREFDASLAWRGADGKVVHPWTIETPALPVRVQDRTGTVAVTEGAPGTTIVTFRFSLADPDTGGHSGRTFELSLQLAGDAASPERWRKP